MLSIYFGRWNLEDDRYINYMEKYFNNSYEDYWIDNSTSRKIIKDIDKSEVIMGKAIDSPVLGVISPTELSGGTKMLITMNIEGNENIYEATHCGPNCSDWILEIGNTKDITIVRRYFIEFSKENFEVLILNDNTIVRNNMELSDKYLEFRKDTY